MGTRTGHSTAAADNSAAYATDVLVDTPVWFIKLGGTEMGAV